jgi:heat shock protein HslJ
MQINTFLKIASIIVFSIILGACKSSSARLKQHDAVAGQKGGVTEKYWKLVELNGNPVVYGETASREAFIILKNEENRVTGNGTCNTLSGTYEIDTATMRIKFSQMVSTMMMCLNMEIEDQLKKALEMTDNYSLSEDGNFLSLNRARMAPLARFEAVYLK